MAGAARKRRHEPATARTAAGNRPDPSRLATAGLRALAGVRERAEAGHAAAGRQPPVRQPLLVDDTIRDVGVSPVTEDEKLFRYPYVAGRDFTHSDTWRVMRIMGEFIEDRARGVLNASPRDHLPREAPALGMTALFRVPAPNVL